MSESDSRFFQKIIKRWKSLIFVVMLMIFILYNTSLRYCREELLSCHSRKFNLKSPKDLTILSFPKVIYFHETSSKGALDARQECALESAARAHPAWQIYVLFTSPISATFTERINDTFNAFTNVQFKRIHLKKYAEHTPAWRLVSDGRLDASKWRVSHTSDVMRYITLYKSGGTYLDTDVIVAKSLEGLSENWAARESKHSIGSSAIRISQDEIGRLVADTIIRELEATFSGDMWGHNGPGVITRALKRICNTDNVTQMSSDTCLGFGVYDNTYFYPVAWQQAEIYFQANQTKLVPDAYAYHVWNKMTTNLTIEKNSKYDELAKKYCPNVYKTGMLYVK